MLLNEKIFHDDNDTEYLLYLLLHFFIILFLFMLKSFKFQVFQNLSNFFQKFQVFPGFFLIVL